MAKDLLDETLWTETAPFPHAVPVLISLAKMGETPLSEYLNRAEGDLIRGEDASLSSEHMAFLRSRQRLVLIDGYDEVPNVHDDLVKQLRTWKIRFALTSRPGFGALAVVRDPERQRTLQEFSWNQAIGYVKKYFSNPSGMGISEDKVFERFDKAWKSHVGRLLRRPLYLKAWCDFVYNSPDVSGKVTYPNSLGDLAGIIYQRTLVSRNLLQGFDIRSREARQITSAFASWFGKIGREAAEGDFHGGEIARLEELGLWEKKG